MNISKEYNILKMIKVKNKIHEPYVRHKMTKLFLDIF